MWKTKALRTQLNVGVTGYTISRGGTAIATVSGGTTSFDDTGLTPGTGYTYQVTASDAAGNVSAPSNQATVTTQADSTPPTAPGTPTATSVTSSQVSLSWTPSSDNRHELHRPDRRGGHELQLRHRCL